MTSPHPTPPSPDQPQPAGYPRGTMRDSSSRGLVFTAVMLAGIAATLGYYSVQLWQGEQAARSELSSARQTMKVLKSEHTAQKQREQVREKKLFEKEHELGETKARLEQAQEELDAFALERADIDAQMRDYRAIAQRFQRLIDSGRLKVSLRRGRMVVDLPAQVLFPSGSADISDEGVKALREVARILRKVKGKRFIVAGHTDNVKIHAKALYSSNWALSAARAVAVTETLVRFGMRPTQLVAAGYGPHDPVASNRKEDGRQQNRRIEIILEPRVRELPERLEQKL